MHRSLPPLTALRAFEAAARHMAVGKAAAELNVTHAAVSQQIRALEHWLGVPLVKRAGRSLALTEAGHAYAAELRAAFEEMVSATRQLQRADARRPVTLTTTPSFASRWLVPRLRRFRQDNPRISIQVAPESRVVDLNQSDFDLAVRYGAGNWDGVEAERLANGALVPVCSPAYLEDAPPLEQPSDLLNHQLLHEDDAAEWAEWLHHEGVDDFDLSDNTMLLVGHLTHQAALQGQGIYLSAISLVEEDIIEGRLVAPLGLFEDQTAAYYLIRRAGVPLREPAQQLHDWILTEAYADQASTDAAITGA